MKFWKSNWPLVFLVALVLAVFEPFWAEGKLPLPADALVGLYHPWRDAFKTEYPNGYPYKNPLITDPIRQQYVYRELAISQLKQGQLPKWNPYSFSGTPLLANVQAATFYPLNLLFWIFRFEMAWSILVLLQPLLSGIFTYFYLKNLRLDTRAALIGAVAFAFSGFMVAWMEWNTIGHVASWLPLILLAKDKLIDRFSWKWTIALIFSEVSMILAGHLQTALYVFMFTSIYLLLRIWQKSGKNVYMLLKKGILFIFTGAAVIVITSVQWWPTAQFIFSSARNFDLPDWHRNDWFLPWQHLRQFFVPDYFGNPATGNYWGVWNYGEFVGYIGLIPFAFALFALLFRKDKKTKFYGGFLLFTLLLALPTFIAKLPYQLRLPFISTLQPSRILILADFCLIVLAALGIDLMFKQKSQVSYKNLFKLSLGLGLVFTGIWVSVLFPKQLHLSQSLVSNVEVVRRNLFLPTVLAASLIIYAGLVFRLTKKNLYEIGTLILLFFIAFDLWRFTTKFISFSDAKLLFPQTATISFLQQNVGANRIMTTDRRLIPPNVATYYRLQSVDGYDPLYLQNYGEIVASWTRNLPDITPAAFNRILTPEDPNVFWADLLGVKYILTLEDVEEPKLKLVFQEGETRVYENRNAFPRAFFAEEVVRMPTAQAVISALFADQSNLDKRVYTQIPTSIKSKKLSANESAQILQYTENEILLETKTDVERILALTDLYSPEWRVFIDGGETTIFPIDYALRGVVVPKGRHQISFRI